MRAMVPCVPDQSHESGALQRQNILLGDIVDDVGLAAGQHAGQLARHHHVVGCGDALAPEVIGRDAHGDAPRGARQAVGWWLRWRVARHQRQSAGLGIGEQAVAVHA